MVIVKQIKKVKDEFVAIYDCVSICFSKNIIVNTPTTNNGSCPNKRRKIYKERNW